MAEYQHVEFHEWTFERDLRCTIWSSVDGRQVLIASLFDHEINLVVTLIESGLRFSDLTGVTIEQTAPKHYRFKLNYDNPLP